MATKEWKEKNVDKMREYRRKWYKENSVRQINAVMSRKASTREWLDALKDTFKCNRCPEADFNCLDFHHTDPDEKDRTVATTIAWGWSKKRILGEIEKCEVLCANCHRKLHAELRKQEGMFQG